MIKNPKYRLRTINRWFFWKATILEKQIRVKNYEYNMNTCRSETFYTTEWVTVGWEDAFDDKELFDLLKKEFDPSVED